MTLRVKVAGTWRGANMFVKVGGTWRNTAMAFIKVGDIWHKYIGLTKDEEEAENAAGKIED